MSSNEKEWNRIYKQLNGHKYFIVGNHDTTNKIKLYEQDYGIVNLGYANIYKYKKYHFYLSHYPTYTANFDDNKKQPLINLFGHTHQSNNFFDNNPYMYHVGVDSHFFTPVSIDNIIEDIKKQKESSICQQML